MAVDPRGVDLKRLLAEDDGQPIVMLNLLRFAEGGWESYEEYGRHLTDVFLPRYGARVLYAGDGRSPLVAEDGPAWDAVVGGRRAGQQGQAGHGRQEPAAAAGQRPGHPGDGQHPGRPQVPPAVTPAARPVDY